MISRKSAVAFVAAAAAVLALVAIARRERPAQPAVWDDPLTRLRFIALGPARFQMGTPQHEHLREAQETLHPVVLTKGYYLAATEVTQAQWTRIMSENPSHFRECPTCPAERVTWFDAQRFIDR